MEELRQVFNDLKDNLYKKDAPPYDIPEVDRYIKESDSGKIIELYKNYKIMKDAVNQMGISVFDVIYKSDKYLEDVITSSDISNNLNKIVVAINTFLGGFTKMLMIIPFQENRFQMKKIFSYLRANRDVLMREKKKYEDSVIKSREDEDKLKLLANDIIDVFVREGLRLKVLEHHSILQDRTENGEI